MSRSRWTWQPVVTTRAVGGAGADRLSNSGSHDVLMAGLAGDDSLQGGTGSDVLLGGADDDTLTGGAGDDALDGR